MATTAPHNSDPTGDTPRPRACGPRDVAALRRPYPTADTLTRLSPARATSGTEPAQRGRTASPVPATVWIIDIAAPADSPQAGPLASIVERVIDAFAPDGGAVAFLPWPATSTTNAQPAEPDPDAGADGLTIDAPTGAALVTGARAHGYTARLLTIPATTNTASTDVAADDGVADDEAHPFGQLAERVRPSSLDLIVTATGPGGIDEPSADRVALLAARALRAGGILAVLTRSHQNVDGLQDLSGTVVTSGQSADLLYLQHLVAVHGPVHHINTDPATPHEPFRHRCVHDDLLVLVQPRDHALDLADEVAA